MVSYTESSKFVLLYKLDIKLDYSKQENKNIIFSSLSWENEELQ